MLPGFFIIGAGKSGTTSLAHQLGQHPEIFVSEPKEPQYFDINWDRGQGWYERYFTGAEGFKEVGEASVTYSLYPEYKDVPERIFSVLGENVRFIYLLRNPVERMLSHIQHDMMNGFLAVDTSLESVLESPGKYRYGSNYATQIRQYLHYYELSQFNIVLFEHYAKNPEQVLRDIFEFLGVTQDVNIADMQPKNISGSKRRLPDWVRKMKRVVDWPVIGSRLKQVARMLKFKERMQNMAGVQVNIKSLSHDEYNYLLDSFQAEIDQLSNMLDKNLSEVWGKK